MQHRIHIYTNLSQGEKILFTSSSESLKILDSSESLNILSSGTEVVVQPSVKNGSAVEGPGLI